MKMKDLTNAELMRQYVLACMKTIKYPNNNLAANNYDKLLVELGKRLGLTKEEIEKIRTF